MQSCSIHGCKSYKTIEKKAVAYFKFPFHNESLLESWLLQINQEDFVPTLQDQICSTHFLIEDIEPSSFGKYPVLKPDAIPTVFERKDDLSLAEKTKHNSSASERKLEVKSPAKKSLDKKNIPNFETVLIPEYSNASENPITLAIPILPKPALIQMPPQKLVQFAQKSATQISKVISAPIQIQSRGIAIHSKPIQIMPKPLQIQPKPLQIQPKPIQLQKVQFHPNIQVQGKQQIVHFQGKQFQIQQKPILLQQNTPIQGYQPNGKLIPLKPINIAELQELLAHQNSTQTSQQVVADGKKHSILKPNILTKKIQNANASRTGSSPDTKRPILKIQINKIKNDGSKKSGVTSKENATKVIRKPEEVQIKALNKSVIFRLEPSGKIVVETVEKKGEVQKVQPHKAINKNDAQKTIDLKTPEPKLSNLKTLYNKAQEDCEKLSKKLAALKKRHQEEQEQILKLQGHLTGLDNKVEKSYDSDISGSSVSKKRKIVSQKEEEDEYEKLLREVRKIKADYDKTSFSKLDEKTADDTKMDAHSMDSDARELENILTQDQTINTTEIRNNNSKKVEVQKVIPVVGKVAPERNKVIMPEIKKCNVIEMKKIEVPSKNDNVQKCDVSPSKTDGEIIGLIDDENEEVEFSEDEMNFEAEYLDPEFIDC